MTRIDSINYTASAAAISSPAWLPRLEEVSQMAALMLPILGVIWLIVQIYKKLTETKKK